jgi:hypothetical protein
VSVFHELPGRIAMFSFKRKSFLVLLLTVGFVGCTTMPMSDVVIGPDFVPGNVFKQSEKLPPTIRRGIVLPISYNPEGTLGLAGKELLEPILHAELTKQNKLELIFLTPEELKLWTGKERWDFQEALPKELLKVMREKLDAEAILFTHVTHYSPYPPIKIGLRLKLTTATDGDVLWSADEILDAGESTVSNSARRYAKAHVNKSPVLEDSRSILLSPSNFGQYAVATLLDTIPGR